VRVKGLPVVGSPLLYGQCRLVGIDKRARALYNLDKEAFLLRAWWISALRLPVRQNSYGCMGESPNNLDGG